MGIVIHSQFVMKPLSGAVQPVWRVHHARVTVARRSVPGRACDPFQSRRVLIFICLFGCLARNLVASEVVSWGRQTNVPPTLTNVAAIAAGMGHSVALKSDGQVVVWGENNYGQTNIPAGLTNVIMIAAGDFHSLALQSNGTVVAWGADTTNSGTWTNRSEERRVGKECRS